MNKDERYSAIALFALCFVCSWSWIVSWLYKIGLYPALFSFLISGLSYYGMWRLTQRIAKKTGWMQLGFLTIPEPDVLYKKPSRIPIIMQAILDTSIFAVYPIQNLLGKEFTMLGFLVSSLLVVFFSIKWYEYIKFNKLMRFGSSPKK
ncbi:MAG: hypothetical protein P1P90_00900 [Patescibacteria group bacterium]|nr:hypothetical protein [Patescibacteria group bacterium]